VLGGRYKGILVVLGRYFNNLEGHNAIKSDERVRVRGEG
jgi:hypothetical protein